MTLAAGEDRLLSKCEHLWGNDPGHYEPPEWCISCGAWRDLSMIPYRTVVGLCGGCGYYIEPYEPGACPSSCSTISQAPRRLRRRWQWIDPERDPKLSFSSLEALMAARRVAQNANEPCLTDRYDL